MAQNVANLFNYKRSHDELFPIKIYPDITFYLFRFSSFWVQLKTGMTLPHSQQRIQRAYQTLSSLQIILLPFAYATTN